MNEEKINSESTEKKKENRHIPAKIVTLILSIGAVVIGIMLLLFSRQIFGDEIGDAILGKDVPNGFVAIGNFFY